eukprot:GHVT01066203.1.p1 GENE.GHVT01066203.1~~GHVT01066203.1.p1  ORF type:complete len:545 (+),score=139.69 GHVT01066203.1:308-1942(+)
MPIKPRVHSTLKVNINYTQQQQQQLLQQALGEQAGPKETLKKPAADKLEGLADPTKNQWFDPSIGVGKSSRERKRKAFHFVDPGSYIREERRLGRRAEDAAKGVDAHRLRAARAKREQQEERRQAATMRELRREGKRDASKPDEEGEEGNQDEPQDKDEKADTTRENKEEDDDDEEFDFDPNKIPLGMGASLATESKHVYFKPWEGDVPNLEWWDQCLVKTSMVLVPGRDSSSVSGSSASSGAAAAPPELDEAAIDNLIEHPPAVLSSSACSASFFYSSLSSGASSVPQLYLTVRERKTLRRRKRQEREKEKQDKVRMGLLAPPPPKVKLANLMRVLGDSAIADPSKVERQVRQQMEERIKAHNERNEARRLTPEQRAVKHVAKWNQDVTTGVQVLLFILRDNPSSRSLWKMSQNAEQLHLSGRCVVTLDGPTAVVVEGGVRAVKRFRRLMLRRIRWRGEEEEEDDANDEHGSDDEEGKPGGHTRAGGGLCCLVWEGLVKSRTFTGWKAIQAETELEAVKVFKTVRATHYWEIIKAYRDPKMDL